MCICLCNECDAVVANNGESIYVVFRVHEHESARMLRLHIFVTRFDLVAGAGESKLLLERPSLQLRLLDLSCARC